MYLNVKNNENKSFNNLLVHSRIQEVNENRHHIYFLLKSILYLAKLGLAFRGKNETNDSVNEDLWRLKNKNKTAIKVWTLYFTRLSK
ncbi:zinc finger MYM-type protein 1-like, partial [Aphis craccivora]